MWLMSFPVIANRSRIYSFILGAWNVGIIHKGKLWVSKVRTMLPSSTGVVCSQHVGHALDIPGSMQCYCRKYFVDRLGEHGGCHGLTEVTQSLLELCRFQKLWVWRASLGQTHRAAHLTHFGVLIASTPITANMKITSIL